MTSAPSAPDPSKTAQTQAALNRDAVYASADVSSLEQFSPFGSVTFDYETKKTEGEEGGEYEVPTAQFIELEEPYQNILDTQTAVAQGLGSQTEAKLGQLPSDQFSLSQIPQTDSIADSMFQRQMSMIEPEVQNRREDMEVMLAERGIPIGSEIYDEEISRFDRELNRTQQEAAYQADIASRNEFQRELENALIERQMPFRELAALQGQTPNFPTPQAQQQPAYSVQPPNFQAAQNQAYQGQLAGHNQQQGMLGNLIGGGLAAAPMLFSDERLKKNKEPVEGEQVLDQIGELPIQEWEYNELAQAMLGLPDQRMTGPMAQDVSQEMGGNPSMINLGDMLGKALAGIQALDQRTEHLAQRG